MFRLLHTGPTVGGVKSQLIILCSVGYFYYESPKEDVRGVSRCMGFLYGGSVCCCVVLAAGSKSCGYQPEEVVFVFV